MTAKSYHGAKEYVLWTALGYAAFGMYTMVFPYLVFIGKTKFLGVITFGSAGINLVGNYILIKLNGPVGAAQATFISYLICFISVWWYSNKIFPMPWRLKTLEQI